MGLYNNVTFRTFLSPAHLSYLFPGLRAFRYPGDHPWERFFFERSGGFTTGERDLISLLAQTMKGIHVFPRKSKIRAVNDLC